MISLAASLPLPAAGPRGTVPAGAAGGAVPPFALPDSAIGDLLTLTGMMPAGRQGDAGAGQTLPVDVPAPPVAEPTAALPDGIADVLPAAPTPLPVDPRFAMPNPAAPAMVAQAELVVAPPVPVRTAAVATVQAPPATPAVTAPARPAPVMIVKNPVLTGDEPLAPPDVIASVLPGTDLFPAEETAEAPPPPAVPERSVSAAASPRLIAKPVRREPLAKPATADADVPSDDAEAAEIPPIAAIAPLPTPVTAPVPAATLTPTTAPAPIRTSPAVASPVQAKVRGAAALRHAPSLRRAG